MLSSEEYADGGLAIAERSEREVSRDVDKKRGKPRVTADLTDSQGRSEGLRFMGRGRGRRKKEVLMAES